MLIATKAWQGSHEELPLIKSHNLLNMWPRDFMWQIEDIENNAHDHQTCQCGDIEWGAPIYKFTWPLNKVVLWGQVTN